MTRLILLFVLALSSCATPPPRVATIDDICPAADDDDCAPATPAEMREFFRRWGV